MSASTEDKAPIYGGDYGIAVAEGDDWIQFRNPKAKDSAFTPKSQNVAATMAASWTAAKVKFGDRECFGTRELISESDVVDEKSGRTFKKNEYGKYQWLSYNEVDEKIMNFAKGLLKIGVQPKTNICMFMNTMADWQIAANACFQTSIVVGTVYATLGDEALAYGFNQTKSSTVITEGSLLPAIFKIAQNCPDLKYIIYNGKKPDNLAQVPESLTLYEFDAVISLGKEGNEIVLEPPTADDIAVIMYTSGSTGLPKGVMLTHNNLLASAIVGFHESTPDFVEEDSFISFLPLAHIFALCAETYLISQGCKIGYSTALTLTDTSPKIKTGTKGDITELCPTYLVAVPTIMDRIRQTVTSRVTAGSKFGQMVFNKGFEAKRLAYLAGEDTPWWDYLIFDKIKSILGGRVKMILCGGAPLAKDSQEFISAIFGVPICQGYGLTETCGGGTIALMSDKESFGKVGGVIASLDLKLVDWEEGGYKVADRHDDSVKMPRGEIFLSGDCIASRGYYNMPEQTKESFVADSEGKVWFRTGDIGQIHPDGSLQIIDRKKDLVKLQQGEYVSLGKVESVLKAANYIDNMMIYADPLHSYCVALVTVNKSIEAWATKNGIEVTEWKEFVHNPSVVAEVLSAIQTCAKSSKLQRFETPTKVYVCEEAWLPDTGLVTASLKLQRVPLKKKFAAEIQAMYD